MVFEIDPDKPDIPAIAQVLFWLGVLSLIGSAVSVLLIFSKLSWVNPNFVMASAVGTFVLALLLIGQAKTLELLALVSARVKSRFAIENTLLAKAAAPPVAAEPKLPAAPSAGRVISIPEQMAREQGLTRTPEPRDFR